MEWRDLETVSEIDNLSFALPWPKSAFKFELLDNPAARLWVAEIPAAPENGRQVIGMLAIWFIVDEIHISTLAVHPDFRRRGTARRLLAEALTRCQQQGAVSATLEVRTSNKAAKALYEKFGFQVAGRRLKYYQDNQEDALLMTLTDLQNLPRARLIELSASTQQAEDSESGKLVFCQTKLDSLDKMSGAY
jgi:ribosomal-protein-alanine N-acetyltransferase